MALRHPRPAGATWAGTHFYRATGVLSATTISEVQQAVRRHAGRVRALGTRHSFNDLADTDGMLVDVLDIHPRPLLDTGARSVEVGAGTRYGTLAAWLDGHGYALHNMGSLPHISVAGAVSTGTHGSGDRLGSLSTAVRGIEYVDASGDLQMIRAGEPDFAGAVVHLGALGIVTRLTLAVEPAYEVRQDLYAGLAWDRLLADFDTVTASAYSVSVFLTWTASEIEVVLRKSRIGHDAPDPGDRFLDARRVGHEDVFDPENWTPRDGSVGTWASRMPHFRFDATPSVGAEIQTEYFVDRVDGPAALQAVRELGAEIDPLLFITELRTVAADELWLSPAYRRDSLGIHFTWRPEPEAVRAVLPRIESALRPFAPRPHWAKWHTVPAETIASRYPRLADARDLFRRQDPDGVFAGPYLERLGLR
jgi:alditol oxidase